ncbi:ABC transporter permease [Sporosalibacterium faouarense]|uniref:ABC transporter permease n=1 Tax=Sporosalibacterium faouarense TaxID=516123 RepID=UPI00141C361E|nr:ABC transporter permease [Sporosalibacterium faouarense]MTI47592.1 ABC transporter permease [Bacillota bacterium]
MSRKKNQNISKEHTQFIRKIKRRNKTVHITQIAILIIGLALWEIAAQMQWIDAWLTSYPSAIWDLFVKYLYNGSLFHHVGVSLMEVIIGFVVGTLLGILIAILLWWSDFISKVLDPYLVVLNSLPKTALAPIIILWAGAGYSGIITTAIAVLIVITIMNIYNGFRAVDEDKIKMLKTFGATKYQILRKVIIPANIPTMISTMKVNIGLSWIGVIVGEFLVSQSGIGHLIVYGGQVFRLDLVMMNVIILAVLASLMYQIVAFIEKKFTR